MIRAKEAKINCSFFPHKDISEVVFCEAPLNTVAEEMFSSEGRHIVVLTLVTLNDCSQTEKKNLYNLH